MLCQLYTMVLLLLSVCNGPAIAICVQWSWPPGQSVFGLGEGSTLGDQHRGEGSYENNNLLLVKAYINCNSKGLN